MMANVQMSHSKRLRMNKKLRFYLEDFKMTHFIKSVKKQGVSVMAAEL